MPGQRIDKLVGFQFHHGGSAPPGGLNLRQQQPVAVWRKFVEIGNLGQAGDGDPALQALSGIPQIEVAILVKYQVANHGEVARRTEPPFGAEGVFLSLQLIGIGIPLEPQQGSGGRSFAFGMEYPVGKQKK